MRLFCSWRLPVSIVVSPTNWTVLSAFVHAYYYALAGMHVQGLAMTSITPPRFYTQSRGRVSGSPDIKPPLSTLFFGGLNNIFSEFCFYGHMRLQEALAYLSLLITLGAYFFFITRLVNSVFSFFFLEDDHFPVIIS